MEAISGLSNAVSTGDGSSCLSISRISANYAQSGKATGVCIGTEDDDENFLSITVEDHQQLKQIEDDVADLVLCLDSTSDTLTTFQDMYGQFCQHQHDQRSPRTSDAVAVALREKEKEIAYTRRKAEALLSRIQNTRTLVRSRLAALNSFAIVLIACIDFFFARKAERP